MKATAKTPVSAVETITPEIAHKMLSANKGNRKLNPAIVARYARILESGDWKINGDAIRLDVKGHVLDGQHRLAAIAQTGIAIDTFVVRGLPREVFDTIDTGKARTSADALFANGLDTNAPLIAAIANLAIKVETNSLRVNRYIEPHVIRKWVVDHPDVADSAAAVKKLPFLGYAPVLGLVHFSANRSDPEKAAEFFAALETGENLKRGDPAYALRETLIKNKKNRGLHKADVLGMALKTWNAYVTGKAISILRKPLATKKEAGLAYAL